MLHVALPLSSFISCLVWVLEHRDALTCAARLLGGEPAARRLMRILDAAPHQTHPTRRCLRELIWLHALLSLENVGDPDQVETECFFEIDPADPSIEEICLLTEALRDHLASISAELKITEQAQL